MAKQKKNKRDESVLMIPGEAKKILDIGCGDGTFLDDHIKVQNREIVGVELDPKECAIAQEKIEKVFCADVESFEPPYEKDYFDCVFYGDVISCFCDPLAVLKKHRELLADGGHVVAAMANIRYYKIITTLIFKGVWDYADGGILWNQHCTFFTLTNIKELFYMAGFEVIEIKRFITAKPWLKFLNFILFNSLVDFITYQYYIKAKKVDPEKLTPLPKRRKFKF